MDTSVLAARTGPNFRGILPEAFIVCTQPEWPSPDLDLDRPTEGRRSANAAAKNFLHQAINLFFSPNMAPSATATSGWYQSSVTSIDPAAQSLLEEYSGLPPDELLPHVIALVSAVSWPPACVLSTNTRGPISATKPSESFPTPALVKCGS